MLLFGTIVNVVTVLTGSLLGLIFHSKLPDRILKICFQSIGLFTIYIGISMALKSEQILILVFSMIIGSAIGEWIDLDKRITTMSNLLKVKLKSNNENFTEGLVTAFLLFCMGSMTIIGAFEEGTMGKSDLLIAKSIMDGFAGLALASTLGIGVAFSVIPLFIFQGGLTLLAMWLGNLMPESVIFEMSAVGGLMLMALGLTLLEIKRIKVINMLPALIIAIILAYITLNNSII